MRNSDGAFSLARQYYRSQDVFKQEQEMVFFRNWVMLGRYDELFPIDQSLPGAVHYFAGEFAGAPYLIIQSESGQLHAFHNVCRHRGATLVCHGRDQIKNGILTCPYHAWSYDVSGKLVGAPNMQGVSSFRRDDFGLRALNVCERFGFVFVNFLDQANDLDSPMEPLCEKLKAWNVAELRIGAKLNYQVQSNWKLLFENYSECYHCPTVHPALNRLTPYRGAENEILSGGVLGGPMGLAEGIASMTLDGELAASHLKGLDGLSRRQVAYYTVFPNSFVSLHPDFVLIHRLMPMGPDHTEIVCEFLVQESDLENSRLQAAVDFWDLTNRQDWEMCERVQKGAESPVFSPGPLSNLESVVAAFDRHYLRAMGNDGGGIRT